MLLNEVLKDLIFFHLPIKKDWLYNTNNEQISNFKSLFVQFIQKKLSLLSTLSFFNLKNQIFGTSEALKNFCSRPKAIKFWILDLKYALKK